jgi:hypothetical protein
MGDRRPPRRAALRDEAQLEQQLVQPHIGARAHSPRVGRTGPDRARRPRARRCSDVRAAIGKSEIWRLGLLDF